MRPFRPLLLLALAVLSLAGCAPQADSVASASAAPPREQPVWAFEASDIPVDPGFRFGRLDNGMRYVVRHNETPQGTAIVCGACARRNGA